MSNSKLNAQQKQFRKDFIAQNPGVQFFSFPDSGVTVAIQETGINMVEFSVSIASPNERKFRRKVGEFVAAERMDNGITLPATKYSELAYIAYDIASTVGN